MKIIIQYSSDGCEIFDGDEKEARYWFERRIEKSSDYAEHIYIGELKEIDVELWKREYEEKCDLYSRQQKERRDKDDYERLRKKYEKAKP